MTSSTPARYTMRDAEDIRKAAARVLIDTRLAAMAHVRDSMVALIRSPDEAQQQAIRETLTSNAQEVRQRLSATRQHLAALTAKHLAETELAEEVTAGSIAEFVGIDLEAFAGECWQGFEDVCVEAGLEGGTANV